MIQVTWHHIFHEMPLHQANFWTYSHVQYMSLQIQNSMKCENTRLGRCTDRQTDRLSTLKPFVWVCVCEPEQENPFGMHAGKNGCASDQLSKMFCKTSQQVSWIIYERQTDRETETEKQRQTALLSDSITIPYGPHYITGSRSKELGWMGPPTPPHYIAGSRSKELGWLVSMVFKAWHSSSLSAVCASHRGVAQFICLRETLNGVS